MFLLKIQNNTKAGLGLWCLMTFNNISVISWCPALLVEESGVPGENHRKSLTNFIT
jgi:hypothetical protein